MPTPSEEIRAMGDRLWELSKGHDCDVCLKQKATNLHALAAGLETSARVKNLLDNISDTVPSMNPTDPRKDA